MVTAPFQTVPDGSGVFVPQTGQTLNPNDWQFSNQTNAYQQINSGGRPMSAKGANGRTGTIYDQQALKTYFDNKNKPATPLAPVAQPIQQDIKPQIDYKVPSKGKNTPSGVLSRMLKKPVVNRPDKIDISGMDFLQGMDDKQATSYLATQALYGSGDKQGNADTFMNLMLNRMLGKKGKIRDYAMNPVEQGYFGNLGITTQSGGDEFLRGVQQYQGV